MFRRSSLALALLAGLGGTAVAADGPDERPAALAACANPALPAAILDGPFDGAPVSLAVAQIGGANVPLTVAVASDEPSRELGLMCVTRLRPHCGMLFAFEGDDVQEFWMKNTLVPLDMIWVRADGVVTGVAARVPASTRATPDARVARRRGRGTFVIELPAGEAARDGLGTGVTLSIPALGTTKSRR